MICECGVEIKNPHFNRKRCVKCAKIAAYTSSRASVKSWKLRNPDRVRTMNKEWALKNANRKRFTHCKDVARRRACAFCLTIEQMINFWTQPCHYCGGQTGHTSLGLDRIDNDRGYEKDNVLPCCGPCNIIRGVNLSVAEMEVAMAAVLKLRGKI